MALQQMHGFIVEVTPDRTAFEIEPVAASWIDLTGVSKIDVQVANTAHQAQQ